MAALRMGTHALNPGQLPRSVARAVRRRRDPRGPRWSAIALTIAVALMIAAMPKARAATATANLVVMASVASKAPRTYNVCGTIPAGQDVTVATYSDTVVATINF